MYVAFVPGNGLLFTETRMSPVLFNMLRSTLCASLLVLSAGCRTVGPDYHGTPAPPLQSQFINEAVESGQPKTAASWQQYQDETLLMLIQLARQGSPTLNELAWRIDESRAVLAIVSGQRDPFAEGFAGYERRKRSANSQPFVASNGQPFNFFSVGVDSRWELDLFGRIARDTEAATADLQATVEDRNDLQRVLIADVVRAYVDIRLYQELMETNETNLKVQRMAITSAKSRIKAGKVGRLDVVQLESRIGLTESDTPLYAEKLRLSFHRLALLVGQTPNRQLESFIGTRPQLSAPNIATGVPADLLRRRPDVRRSEREVAAACARIGVAEAELYPKLALAGTVSLNSRNLSNLFEGDSILFGFGPSFSWNILSLGRIEKGVDVRKAQLEQAIARYQQTVLQAVSEVENGLASYQMNLERTAILTKAVEDSGEAIRLASQQYEADRASLERVVSNQRRLLRTSIELTRTRAELAGATVNLIQAVGADGLDGIVVDGVVSDAPCCARLPKVDVSEVQVL